jgi:phenylpropionate dioxygenase-like ring-hydroxylating dioxygenase large terminal subunit
MDGFSSIPSDIRPDFIPASDFTAADLVKREKEYLWPRVWQMACRVEEIPKVGDFVNYQICDESILVTRTAADEIRAYYNVCQHRGRKLRDEERGHAGAFYCRFHGWRYDLQGALTYVHGRDDWNDCPTFKESELGLKTVKVDTWAGWVWINQDPDSVSLSEYLGDAAEVLGPFELENARMAWYHTIIAPVNWKVVCEAFNEGYHAPATHTSGMRYGGGKSPGVAHGDHSMFYSTQEPGSVSEYLEPSTGQWVTAGSMAEAIWAGNRHVYRTLFAMTLEPGMAANSRLKAEIAPETPPMEVIQKLLDIHREELEKRGVAYPQGLTLEALAKAGTDWHIFPNSIVLPTVDGALWYRVRPNRDDPDSCVFDIWSFGRYAPGQEPLIERQQTVGFKDFKGNNPFLEEDFENMEAVNEGMKSRGWTGARTSPIQEVQINNFHRALRRYGAAG